MDETAVEVLVVRSGESIYVNDAWTDKRVSRKRLKITDSKEYCAVPLKGRSGVLGVFTADKVYSRNPIVPDEIQTLELFAGHISLAIENAVLFEEKERFASLLEKKISERTLELAQTNARLQLKMKELSTLLIVPLRSKEKLLGVLVVFILKGHAFGKEQVKFFSAFGLQVSMALKNALAFQEILDQKNRMENLSRPGNGAPVRRLQ